MNILRDFFYLAEYELLAKGLTAKIFKNMDKFASGVGISTLIAFLTIPAITHTYTPEDFGVLSVFTSAIVLIVSLKVLLHPITIPLPKHDGMVMNIVHFLHT